jgi:crossover junction endodeoxyribonuclease RuvC
MNISKRRILGIDPALARTGFGIIEDSNGKLNIITCGVIASNKNETLPYRLKAIFDGIKKIILEFNPDEVAIESPFFAKNVKVAIKMGQASGAALIASIEAGATVFIYSPLEIKQSVVGYGRADKEQVQNMVKNILRLDKIPEPHDAADALAAAICHANYSEFKEKIKK